MTLMGDFDWDGLVAVDRLMAQILCGTYFALAGVVCMNLYIALLSDTFARVYAQAQANAVMQQAQTVILLENKLNREKKLKFGHFMQNNCSPEVLFLFFFNKLQNLGKQKPDTRTKICHSITFSLCYIHRFPLHTYINKFLLLEGIFLPSIMLVLHIYTACQPPSFYLLSTS